MAPEPSTRMAANGSASRVTSDPKIEIVAALQTRTKAWLRQRVEANGLRTDGASIDGRIRGGVARTGTIVRRPTFEDLRYTPPASVRQNSRTTRPGSPPFRITTTLGVLPGPCSTPSASGFARRSAA